MNATIRRTLCTSPIFAGLVLLAALWTRLPEDRPSPPEAPRRVVEQLLEAHPSVIPAAQASEPASASEAAAPRLARPPVAIPLPTEDPPVFRLFNLWAATYVNAKPAERASIIPAGVALAAERRAALAELIPADPQRALSLAVPFVIRQQLPPEIVEQLEERVSAKAFFGVLTTQPDGKGGPAIKREVRLENGKRYKAYVFGRRLTQQTTQNAIIAGIAVDRVMAVDHRPLRVLEAGEVPDRGVKYVGTARASAATIIVPQADGRVSKLTKRTPVVEVAGKLHFLGADDSVEAFESRLIAAESGTGPPERLEASAPILAIADAAAGARRLAAAAPDAADAEWGDFRAQAIAADPLLASAIRTPVLGMDGTAATLTYERPVDAGGAIYEIEQCADFTQPWTLAPASEQILSEENGVRIVKASVPAGLAPQVLLRLRVTAP